MPNPENRLFCRIETMPGSEKEQQRLNALSSLGLLEVEHIPVFDEATQTAAHLLDAPICVLGVIDHEREWLKSAVGLSRIGLMNELASSRQLPRNESFCTHVVDSQQILVIQDASTQSPFAEGMLSRRYGIRAYLGVPLFSSSGYCLGTLAVMERSPRHYTDKEIEFLELIGRWCISEYERNHLLKTLSHTSCDSKPLTAGSLSVDSSSEPQTAAPSTGLLKTNLLVQMVQELRTPLTSILGMASVLTREIYGPLTQKQKEYMGIVHTSGQYLLSLVNEILELGTLDDRSESLNLNPVDIEMLCQKALSTLEKFAERREQTIRLTVEPGPRIWLLDKDKVRQILYHLVFSLIQASSSESIIRVHVSRKRHNLFITLWMSHPWLGDGLPPSELQSMQLLSTSSSAFESELEHTAYPELSQENALPGYLPSTGSIVPAETAMGNRQASPPTLRQNLGLSLSQQLASIHGGSITIQGTPEAGYRYVISLPQTSGDAIERG